MNKSKSGFFLIREEILPEAIKKTIKAPRDVPTNGISVPIRMVFNMLQSSWPQTAGLLPADDSLVVSGTCETASQLIISYVPQDTSFLHGSIPEFCENHMLDRSLFCTVLRQLDFSRSQLTKDISDYSAGQKKKVLLAASLLTPAHIYIWDEPLNFIDVFSRMQIETLLETYHPTMLFAEHDIRFRENIATETICL